MDAILDYLGRNPLLMIVLLIGVALVFSWVTGGSKDKVDPEDLVPHYKRFERRETELGNRRQSRGEPVTDEDRRKLGRRASDWLRRKR